MGLLDEVLKTMQAGGVPNDPRARPAPVPAPTPGVPESHGMSPMAKALLALLAAYAAKIYAGRHHKPHSRPLQPVALAVPLPPTICPVAAGWTICSKGRWAAFSVADRGRAQARAADWVIYSEARSEASSQAPRPVPL